MAVHQAPLSLGFFRQEYWSGLPFPSSMHESEKWKWSHWVMSNSQRPRGLQPTRLLRPWDFPGKSTGVGCHCLLQVFTLRWSYLLTKWIMAQSGPKRLYSLTFGEMMVRENNSPSLFMGLLASSLCSPWTWSISIISELARSVRSQAPPWICWIRIYIHMIPRWFLCTFKFNIQGHPWNQLQF